ncbi:MAG: hypothetical protein AAB915_01245 [Patescibacteria group bacterium]
MSVFGNLLSEERKPIIGALIVLAVVAVAFAPVFFGRWVNEEDSIFYSLPFYKFYSDALQSGEDYHLAPGILSGFPASLTYSGGLGDPLNSLIFRIFPFIFGYAFRTFLNYALAAVFVFLLCRTMGMNSVAGLVAALAFITTNVRAGFIMVHSGSFLILTGLFYVAAKIFESNSLSLRRNLFFMILGTGIFYAGMAGGAAQFNLQSLVLVFLFVLFLSWKKYAESKSMRPLLGPYVLLVIIFGAGIALFIPHVLRVLEFAPHTVRAGGLSWEQVLEMSPPPGLTHRLLSFLFLFFPRTFGIPGVIESSSLFFFIGSAGLLFFVSSFFLKKSPAWYAFFGLCAFAFLSSFHYPFFYLMHTLPLFSFFRAPGSWLLFNAMLPVSVMAGFGCQSFMETKPSRYVRAVIAATAVFIGLALLFLAYHTLDEPTLVILNAPGGRDIFWALVLWVPVLYWFYRAFTRPKEKNNALFITFLAVIVISGTLITFWTQLFDKATSLNAHSFLKKPWVIGEIENIEGREGSGETFRVFNFLGGDTQWSFFAKRFNPDAQTLADFQREAVVPGNANLFYGIEDVSGTHDNLITRRYEKAQFFFENISVFDVLKKEERGTFVDIPANKIRALGMMNVKYIWISVPFWNTAQDKVEVVAFQKVAPYDVGILLYRNKEFLPRVHSPKKIIFLEESEDNFSEIFEKEHDFKEVGFVECGADPPRGERCPAGSLRDQIPPAIRIQEVHNGSVSFSTDGADSSWVIVSGSFIPRWRASIDGMETKIHYANYVYQGIRVPAGKHAVRLSYEP